MPLTYAGSYFSRNRAQLIETVCVLPDVVAVDQAVANQDVRDAVQQRKV